MLTIILSIIAGIVFLGLAGMVGALWYQSQRVAALQRELVSQHERSNMLGQAYIDMKQAVTEGSNKPWMIHLDEKQCLVLAERIIEAIELIKKDPPPKQRVM